MDKNKKIIIIVSIIIVLMLSVFLIFKFTKNDSQVIKNPQDEIIQQGDIFDDGIKRLNLTRIVNGLEFSNVQIEKIDDRKYELRADVINKTNEAKDAQTVNITVTDDKGELKEIWAGQVSSLLPGGKTMFSAPIRKDISSATNVEFEIQE